MIAQKKPLIQFQSAGVPATLKSFRRWAPWAAVWNPKKEKYDKIPKQADAPAFGLSTRVPDKWFPFAKALKATESNQAKLAGVGYCMTEPHGIVGIDLDHCVGEDGERAGWVDEIITKVGSYAEVSPSGTGIRIFALGETACDWTNHEQGIEVYGGHEARFLTVTGAHLPGTPKDLQVVDPELLAELAARYARERRTADIIDLTQPELLDDFLLPSVDKLSLPDLVARFLENGEDNGDRSAALHASGVALYSSGLSDAEVFSTLVTNEHAMTVALDHRRQDHDRALHYMWREHCLKAKPKASSPATAEEFDLVIADPDAPAPLPAFKRDSKGKIEATLLNLDMALRRPDVCGVEIRLDRFKDAIMYSPAGRGDWRPLGDADYSRIRIDLERRMFKPIGRELIRDAVLLVADDNQFDSAIEWINGLTWDGVERIDSFYKNYFGAEDSAYIKAVSAYTWTALAGRVLAPGIKVDMVPILRGAQGLGKSFAVAAMSPSVDFFAEVNLKDRDDDLSRKMRGCLVAEIGELRGLHDRDMESIKAFITRTHEHWVPKYREFAIQFPRRLLFIGTTNQEQFLADPTGNRRWLPFEVSKANSKAIQRDRDQLWAEAKTRFELFGIEFQQAEELGKHEHDRYMLSDAWESIVADWLDEGDGFTGEIPRTRDFLRTSDILREALGMDAKTINRAHEMRIGNILREMGYERKKKWLEGAARWVFIPSIPYLKT